MKTQFNTQVDVSTIDALRERARYLDVPIGELPARPAYDVIADDGCAEHDVTIAALRAENARLRRERDKQVDYSIALQRIIEALAAGRPLPDARMQSPHIFNLATTVQADLIALRAELAMLRAERSTIGRHAAALDASEGGGE